MTKLSTKGATSEILRFLTKTKINDMFEIPIHWGDTLWTIAKKNNIKVKARKTLDQKKYTVWVLQK